MDINAKSGIQVEAEIVRPQKMFVMTNSIYFLLVTKAKNIEEARKFFSEQEHWERGVLIPIKDEDIRVEELTIDRLFELTPKTWIIKK